MRVTPLISPTSSSLLPAPSPWSLPSFAEHFTFWITGFFSIPTSNHTFYLHPCMILGCEHPHRCTPHDPHGWLFTPWPWSSVPPHLPWLLPLCNLAALSRILHQKMISSDVSLPKWLTTNTFGQEYSTEKFLSLHVIFSPLKLFIFSPSLWFSVPSLYSLTSSLKSFFFCQLPSFSFPAWYLNGNTPTWMDTSIWYLKPSPEWLNTAREIGTAYPQHILPMSSSQISCGNDYIYSPWFPPLIGGHLIIFFPHSPSGKPCLIIHRMNRGHQMEDLYCSLTIH